MERPASRKRDPALYDGSRANFSPLQRERGQLERSSLLLSEMPIGAGGGRTT
jgi:hypothetical protein